MVGTYGELCAGIGGIGLGLERAGWECRFQVEIDEFCRFVLAKHWPDVPRFSDVREVGARDLPYVDIIAFGSGWNVRIVVRRYRRN